MSIELNDYGPYFTAALFLTRSGPAAGLVGAEFMEVQDRDICFVCVQADTYKLILRSKCRFCTQYVLRNLISCSSWLCLTQEFNLRPCKVSWHSVLSAASSKSHLQHLFSELHGLPSGWLIFKYLSCRMKNTDLEIHTS